MWLQTLNFCNICADDEAEEERKKKKSVPASKEKESEEVETPLDLGECLSFRSVYDALLGLCDYFSRSLRMNYIIICDTLFGIMVLLTT